MREFKDTRPIQSYNLPAAKNTELITKDQKLIAKAKVIEDKLEKGGNFYVLKDFFPKTELFIPKGKNVQESIENYLKKIGKSNTTLRKMKI
jgi:hypothetical protein